MAKIGTGTVIALTLLAGALLSGGGKRKSSSNGTKPTPTPGPDPEPDPDLPEPPTQGELPPGVGTPKGPRIVGNPNDPEIAQELATLDEFLASYGVLKYTSARELTTMPQAPGAPVAIPPYELWGNIVPTLELWQAVREELGLPMALRAYRPADYNEAVGGTKGSLHVWFAAVDVRISGDDNTADNRQRLALAAARLYREYGSEYRIGFGAYGAPVPGNIHLDSGWKKRTWEDAKYYIDALASA